MSGGWRTWSAPTECKRSVAGSACPFRFLAVACISKPVCYCRHHVLQKALKHGSGFIRSLFVETRNHNLCAIIVPAQQPVFSKNEFCQVGISGFLAPDPIPPPYQQFHGRRAQLILIDCVLPGTSIYVPCLLLHVVPFRPCLRNK